MLSAKVIYIDPRHTRYLQNMYTLRSNWYITPLIILRWFRNLKKYNKFTVISLFLLQYYENITEITQRYVLCKLGIDRHTVAVSQASKGGQ